MIDLEGLIRESRLNDRLIGGHCFFLHKSIEAWELFGRAVRGYWQQSTY
jgi:hypothetical protein